MIQLAFSTNAFKKNTFEEALRSIASIGYTAVELMADLHHAYPPIMTEARVAQIKALLAEFGAKTISLQPGGPMIGSGLSREEAGRRFADGIERCVPLAKQKGVILA